MELIFLDIHLEASLSEFLKNLPYIFLILFKGLTIDQDIIKVGLVKVVEEFEQNIIHILLI